MNYRFKWLLAITLACVMQARQAGADEYVGNFTLTSYHGSPAVGGTLNGGATYIYGGGMFGAKLDGVVLHNTYCLDILNHISPGVTYASDVSTDGDIYHHLEKNAGSIAWLINNVVTGGDATKEAALQGLIWELVSPNTWSANFPENFVYKTSMNSAAMNAAYAADVAALAAATTLYGGNLDAWISTALWISPHPNSRIQAQVASAPGFVPPPPPGVPEPSSLALLGLGGIGWAVGAIRRRKLASAA